MDSNFFILSDPCVSLKVFICIVMKLVWLGMHLNLFYLSSNDVSNKI